MTRLKLFAARGLYRALKILLRTDQRRVQRKGISYDVDLSEGIDLSLFLFGNFQSHVLKVVHDDLPSDAVILDIGANIGSMALQFARLAPEGRVYAFEPTHYAAEKFQRNLALNTELSKRIEFIQAFVSDQSSTHHNLVGYASWKVDKARPGAHPTHGGTIQPAEAVPSITVDDFCEEKQLHRVDLIKIDTDGHEFQVLQGARRTLAKHGPRVVFEVGLYLLHERGMTFEQYLRYFSALGYVLFNTQNGKPVTQDNYWKEVPLSYTTDLIALPHHHSMASRRR
jgi:FkbM family methyltransferase